MDSKSYRYCVLKRLTLRSEWPSSSWSVHFAAHSKTENQPLHNNITSCKTDAEKCCHGL